jgi:hypothetical protein
VRDVIVAELDSPDRAIETARCLRALGYSRYARVEAYTPFPLPELDDALAIGRTRIPYLVLLAAIAGASLSLLIQWWTNAFDYPLNVGGRPLSSLPTNVPIVFETTVLFAGITAFVSVLLGGRLPRLHHPVFDLPGFERTSIDRFWIVIGDPLLPDEHLRDEELTVLNSELARLGARVFQARIERDAP